MYPSLALPSQDLHFKKSLLFVYRHPKLMVAVTALPRLKSTYGNRLLSSVFLYKLSTHTQALDSRKLKLIAKATQTHYL